MTTRKTPAKKEPEGSPHDYNTTAIVAAILIHKGTPIRSALETATWIVESLKNESIGTK